VPSEYATLPRLVIATNNPGKLREFRELLDGSGFELVTPERLGVPFSPDETGATFEQNATIKALAAMRATGLLALADDSGLEVDALDGRPGIFSARYAGDDRTDPGLSDEDRVRIVLDEMRDVPDAQRAARFRCVVALAAQDGTVQTVDGVFEGRIGREPRGHNGFGYDPIFVVPELEITSAEMPPAEKNAISHRGQAALKARELLRQMSHDLPTV
jgi:XTP/dITP diphosphohydrolase